MTEGLRLEGLGHQLVTRWLFRDLDVRFEPGTLTAVLGRNGSGKSTLLRRLAGLEPPQLGSVRLGELTLSEIDPRARARGIAYLPQQTPLYHDLDVRELTMLGRAPHLGRWGDPSPEDLRACDEALERVELTGLVDRKLSTLSGGERQRAMLARMLATGAPVLILDEPCAALDVAHALTFLHLARQLAHHGSVVIIAIHDLELVRHATDHVLCLGVDAEGAWKAGPTAEVMSPELLRQAFGVEVDPRGGFAFSLPGSGGPS